MATIDCKTIQIIEPDSDLLTAISSGSADPSLDERGEYSLGTGQVEAVVTFTVTKAGDYRFEYLYVDAFGILNPGGILPVVQNQDKSSFKVELTGAPILGGYILRWRVVVIAIGGAPLPGADPTETFYVQLPNAQPPGFDPILGHILFTYFFKVQRTSTGYGFSELRVENLIDQGLTQTIITPQIVFKGYDRFIALISSLPPTANYYLAGRTP